MTSINVGGGLTAHGVASVPHAESDDDPALVCSGEVEPGDYSVDLALDPDNARERVKRRLHLVVVEGGPEPETRGEELLTASFEANARERGDWHMNELLTVPDGVEGATVATFGEHMASREEPREMLGSLELYPRDRDRDDENGGEA